MLAEIYLRKDDESDNSKSFLVKTFLLIGEFSELVLRLFDIAGEVNNKDVKEDNIKGEVHEIEVDKEEDMIAYACHLLESWVLERAPAFDVRFQRERVVHTLLNFLIL